MGFIVRGWTRWLSGGAMLVLGACDTPVGSRDAGPDAVPAASDTDDSLGTSDSDANGGAADSDLPEGCESCADADDGDLCTVAVCQPDGSCAFEPLPEDGPTLLDRADLRDPATLDVQVLSTKTVTRGGRSVRVQELRFTSWESEACELRPVRIEAWVAMRASQVGQAGSVPGLVVAHGLGQFADENAATGPAAEHGVVTLAYSGPGQGGSEGWGSVPDHLFDTLHTVRDSWLWEHAAAAMRGITLLSTLPEVDTSRLGMTGYSGGSVATLMVAGVDHRLAVSIPVSATGFMDLAVQAHPVPGWQVDLLADMQPPRTLHDPEWQRFVDHLDPKHFIPTTQAATLLINGAQDQFFPITSMQATHDALRAANPANRALTLVNWDHGWFALFSGDGPIQAAEASTGAWLRHHFGLSGGPAALPPEPQLVSITDQLCGSTPCARIEAFLPSSPYTVVSAKASTSVDGHGYLEFDLSEAGGVPGGTRYTHDVPWVSAAEYDTSRQVWFVTFRLRQGLLGAVFSITSPISLPPGFVPVLLPIEGPMP